MRRAVWLAPAPAIAALVVVLSTLGGGVSVVAGPAPTAAPPLVVNTVSDHAPNGCTAGDCTLREALLELDAAGTVPRTINFNISGNGVHTIVVDRDLGALPAISQDGTTINGYSQPGSAQNSAGPWQPGNADIRIVLDGSALEPGGDGWGLWLLGGGLTISGLSIVNFEDEGIKFATFASAAIKGNYIGIRPDGTPGPNGTGITLRSSQSGNGVGGFSPGDRNVISGNNNDGIVVSGGFAVSIAGNFIGTNPAGDAAIPNGFSGLALKGGPGSTVGGSSDAGAGNLVSGNGGNGITHSTSDARNANVKGNRIGVAADGVSPLGNQGHGVFIDQFAHDNTIGGDFIPAEKNIIAYNGGAGVALSSSAGNRNYIDPNYTYANEGLGNDLLADGAVLPNDFAGPCPSPPASTTTPTPSPGPTPSPFPDCDDGPNELMNYPVLDSATHDGTTLTLIGSLDSVPNRVFNLFAFTNSECDPSGFGEGKRFIDSFGVSTNAAGRATIARQFNLPNIGDEIYITVSASNPESTSEFSQCKEVVFTGPTLTPSPTSSATASPTPTATPGPTASPTPTATSSPTLSPSPTTPPDVKSGDLDCDDQITPMDAWDLLAYIAGVEPGPIPDDCPDIGDGDDPPLVGDLNCDGNIDAFDVLAILLVSEDLEPPPNPTGCPSVGSVS